MKQGFKATLFAGVITLSAFAPAFAAAPVISGLPDVEIGDLEDSTQSTDSNLFVYTNAFDFSDYVVDPDTPAANLIWSFGEFDGSLGTPQYSINGVTAVNQGDVAIATDQGNGNANAKAPGANQINLSTTEATFRDIILSPPPGSGPFPDPADPVTAAAGKALVYYVADAQGGFDSHIALISTVDDGNDQISFNAGWQVEVTDTDFTSTDWENSGILSEGVVNGKDTGRLTITVSPVAGKYRIYGWQNQSLMGYDDIGASKFVRGKFYVYASNEFYEPVNTVPNFRLRVTNEGAVNASNHYEFALTDNVYGLNSIDSAIAELRAGYWLRPGDNSAIPSLYRVDLDPIDVAAATGTNVGVVFESLALSGTANGTLSLTEVVLGTYDALSSGALVWEYNKATGLAGGVGGPKTLQPPPLFNAAATFVPGVPQALDLTTGPFASITDTGATGIVGDSNAVAQDVFGVGILNVFSTNPADRLRIEADKLYHAKFYATAPVPTDSANPAEESQGQLRFRFQTAAGTMSHLLDLAPPSVLGVTATAKAIGAQAIPGVGSQNPNTDPALDTAGEDGGWYSVVVASPLNTHSIREDLNDNFFLFGIEPGPGVAADSARDVTLGVDLIQNPANLDFGGGVILPFARPNRAFVRISAIEVYEYPAIDDGGYN